MVAVTTALFTTVIIIVMMARPGALLPVDLIHRAIGAGDDIDLPVRSGVDVGDDAKVGAEQKTLAFGDVVFVRVVRHPIPQARIFKGEGAAVLVASRWTNIRGQFVVRTELFLGPSVVTVETLR